MRISKKEAIIQILKFHMKQTPIYKTFRFFRVQYMKMKKDDLVIYLGHLFGKNGICERTEVVIDEETECDYCMGKYKKGSKMSRLYDIEVEEIYYLCPKCANETIIKYKPEEYIGELR